MTRIIASLFSVVLSFCSVTAFAAQDRMLENLAAQSASELTNLYHKLGARAQRAGKSDQALLYHAKAAELSLDERTLRQSTQPKFCGKFTQYGKHSTVGRTYCAATLESCILVLTAAERNTANMETQTLTASCGPVYGK